MNWKLGSKARNDRSQMGGHIPIGSDKDHPHSGPESDRQIGATFRSDRVKIDPHSRPEPELDSVAIYPTLGQNLGSSSNRFNLNFHSFRTDEEDWKVK